MNKNNAAQYLPLVQALAEGKTIQCRRQEGWHDEAYVSFMSPPSEYRIKPQVVKYRRYLRRYLSFGGEGEEATRVHIVNYCDTTEGLLSFISGESAFIKWIDKDWVEYELD